MAEENHEIWCDFCGQDQRSRYKCCDAYENDCDAKQKAIDDKIKEAQEFLFRNGIKPSYGHFVPTRNEISIFDVVTCLKAKGFK